MTEQPWLVVGREAASPRYDRGGMPSMARKIRLGVADTEIKDEIESARLGYIAGLKAGQEALAEIFEREQRDKVHGPEDAFWVSGTALALVAIQSLISEAEGVK